MVQASGNGDVEVPPTIQALLSARLDQLEASERRVLERGSVEGEVFHRGAVTALSPEEQQLTARLTSLVRKELLRPDKAQLAGEDAFRFRHVLIREAAYESLPKGDRADLHEQFADWLAEHGDELVELDELVGYHLEQAYRYRHELGQTGSDVDDLAARAAERLRVSGTRAILRDDARAAVNLLERAADLLPDERRDGRFEIDVGAARLGIGEGVEAVAGLREAAARAEAAGDRVKALGLRLAHASYELAFEPTESGARGLRELAEQALPVFNAAGEEWALTVASGSLLLVEELGGTTAAVAEAAERVIEHARAAGWDGMSGWGQLQLCLAQYWGPTSVAECMRWLDDHPDFERRSVLPHRDRLLAMLGRLDEAQRLLAEAAERVEELGSLRFRIWLAWRRYEVARLSGDYIAAEAAAREARDAAMASAEVDYFELRCNLAEALLGLGRNDEAEQWLERGRERDPIKERWTPILWHQLRGKLLARRGELEEGEQLAREAVALAAETDRLNAHADALVDLAEVLALSGQDGRPELEEALALYERKGNVVTAERTRSRLAKLTAP